MNNVNINTQDRSPDFVLMRLVSAAEYDDLEPDGEDVLNPEKSISLTPGGGGREEPNYSTDRQTCQWIPVLRLSNGEEPQEGLCHRHTHIKDHSIGDKPGHITPTPGTGTSTSDPVLNLARQLGEIGPSSDTTQKDERDVSVCSCQPGEDPSETSDALLVLEGLGTNTVGHKEAKEQSSFAQTLSDSASLSGLMRQLTSDPSCQDAATPCAPSSRPPTPKHVGSALQLSACGSRASERGKSRKGSLKVCLSKLFRTKSTGSPDGGHMTNKRPSLASSTSSGGSLVDVFGQSLDTTRSQMVSPHSASFSPVPFTGETVSLVDVDFSRRSVNSLHPPTPPPPPRRSLSLLDDFAVPQPGRLLSSAQSLQPTHTHSHTQIHHSLSLNDTTLRSVPPRPRPIQNNNPLSGQLQRRSLLCPLTSSFATSLRELEKCGWYWGPMNWEDAEMKLKGKADGSFLVRDSSDPRYILSLSFRSQGVTHHTRMEHYRGTFSLWCHPKFEDRCHSVVEFIERAIMHSKNGRFLYFLRSRVPGLPPTPVQLLYPVSRFSSVKSLQHLCRFCIRQLVRIDHIQELPLPTPVIGYLRKFYFYDPEEEKNLSIRESGRDTSAQETDSQT
ncbi:suppressor of cytokine signaling 7-like isoform X1 [Tachysurus vachellii]|uniref:suppressor of cytokine signaling 7-like isoform X1 n=1 Tax=Tachysurus vachellii TaxID=175792 RepID=UPI00296A9FFC|nr:suppressor of cytokine signaling 7-like isoform X1 [Tachysurus vachellii]